MMLEEDPDLMVQPTFRMAVGNIPAAWWIPQQEQAVLALCCTAFWSFTILQAIQKDSHGASVVAFFGLGLIYTTCVLANALGGLKHALAAYDEGLSSPKQVQGLAQLFGILCSMMISNAMVLSIYLSKGTTLTKLDIICILTAAIITTFLAIRYGLRRLLVNPFARGWLAIACKAMPQFFLAVLFLTYQPAAQAFTVFSLGSLTILAALRFWPSIKAYRRDPASLHLQGLLLSECGNMASLLCMVGSWAWARIVLPGA